LQQLFYSESQVVTNQISLAFYPLNVFVPRQSFCAQKAWNGFLQKAKVQIVTVDGIVTTT